MSGRRAQQRNLLDKPEWARYARWNRAVAQVLFPPSQAGVPVYLDLEDDILPALAGCAGEESEAPAESLISAVAGTVDGQSTACQVLRTHHALVEQWERSKQIDPPPHLALLAVLSLAAERMAAGDGLSSANYYGRLAPLLGMEGRRDDLAQAYREVAERWWGALNRWLENHDGRRGLPTAYSLSQQQRYVGLPISQALVRAADRDGLIRFFQRVGFTPGTDVAPQALLPLLDAWITQNPSPATKSLQRLWARPTARDRVAEVAAVALSAWDGTVRGAAGDGRSQESLRITATIGGWLRPRLEIGVLAYLEHPEEMRDVRVTTATGCPHVTAVPLAAGAMRLSGMQDADMGSLLDGVLSIRDPLTTRLVTRRPRRLIPLRRQELLQQLVEADQVQAGEDLVLLVDRALLPALQTLLDEVARPGWSVVENLAGVPSRWAVVSDVQVLRAPGSDPQQQDLRPLVPLTRTSLVLAGGFAIPGRLRRWHSARPPEIRALDDAGQALCVRLLSLDHEKTGNPQTGEGEHEVLEMRWVSSSPGALVVDLNEAELADGDYRIELFRIREKEPITSLVLRLRSADVRDLLQWERSPSLGHRPTLPLSVLSAVAADEPGHWLRGAWAPTTDRVVETSIADLQPPPLPQWRSRPPSAGGAPLWRLAAPDPASCIFTGRHRFIVPQDNGGRPAAQFIPITCTGCGLVKRVATTAWAARKRDRGIGLVAQVNVHAVQAVRSDDIDRWGPAIDCLGYLGGGDWGLLEKVALQVESSALFVDQFARTLEALGHIEVERDPVSLEPVRWEITGTTLVGSAGRRWHLIGYWPPTATDELQGLVERAGGGLYSADHPEGLRSWFVEMPDGAQLPDLTDLDGLTVVPDGSRAVADCLCDLSELIEALPRRSADLVGDVTMFSPIEARWLAVSSLAGPGAYRVRRWSTLDVVRTPVDVQTGNAARSTVQLSKHVAALEAGRLLIAYDHRTRDLTVPLGADLPGLYGRAAVLASGHPPVAHRETRELVYPAVPHEVATILAHRLSS